MALITRIIIMDNITIKPMFIIDRIDSMFLEGHVCEIEILGGSYILICIYYCYIDGIWDYFWGGIWRLYLEREIIVVLLDWKERLREYSVNCEVVSCCYW